MSKKSGNRVKVVIGKIYLRSGNVLPFCAEHDFTFEFNWLDGVRRITGFTNWSPKPFKSRDIGVVNFLDWGNVEAIVTEEEVEIYESELMDE